MTGCFTTALVVDGQVQHWTQHVRRLQLTVRHLGLHWQAEGLTEQVAAIIAPTTGLQRLRITLMSSPGGQVDTHTAIMPYIPPADTPLRLLLASQRLDPGAAHVGYKVTTRAFYDQAYAEAQAAGYDDALILNTRGHVVETAIANIFIEKHGQLCTPPLADGCLNGIMRDVILQERPVITRSLTLDAINNADAVYVTNGLQGVRVACLVT